MTASKRRPADRHRLRPDVTALRAADAAGPGNPETVASLERAANGAEPRLILVSNRLPVSIERSADGHEVRPSPGGLARSLWPLHQDGTGVWVGWPGELPANPVARRRLVADLRSLRLQPIPLAAELVEGFYHGFSNSVLWPLLHYAVHLAVFDRRWWAPYRAVNRLFAAEIAQFARPGDTIWVHDYHLMLLPDLLRRRLPDARIGFFLHTPFPSAEIFRALPWRFELLRGLVGADLIGFHIYAYQEHFRIAAMRVLGVEGGIDHLQVDGRTVRIATFPVGIAAEEFSRCATGDEQTREELEQLERDLKGRRLILGVDRMDYTKGIPERLAAYERFLERYPRHHGQVEFIQIGVPTRDRVEHYRILRRRVEEIVGRINGRFGTSDWTPVKYSYRPVPLARLCALYRYASVALVTPLRDGMNLVAKEYVACQRHGGDGVLVLSEFAGAAAELTDALLVNPYDTDSLAATINRALSLRRAERRSRLAGLAARVWQAEAVPWAAAFLGSLAAAGRAGTVHPPRLAGPARDRLIHAWRAATSRVLLLDYDGTLVPIASRPEYARPDRALFALLAALAALPGVEVVVVSGRDWQTLGRWLGHTTVSLIAEHGRWLRRAGAPWEDLLGGQTPPWLGRIKAIVDDVVALTPGSFAELKSASVVWHYRGADSEQADLRARELLGRLRELREDPPLDIVHGKKALEVRAEGVSKASAMVALLSRLPPTDLLFAAGDDQTDEEMFAQLPPSAWSVHVGSAASRARFSLADPASLRALLEAMAKDAREVSP
jgi:trehalose 6-phosphate synthase/phosphatase